jgi:putative transposase
MENRRTSDNWDELSGVYREDSRPACGSNPYEIINCKFCGASEPIKYGHSKGVQCWKCKRCHRKFVDNKAAPRMRTPKEQIAYALSTYYEGIGFKRICQNLRQKYNGNPSDSTFYEWIERYTQKAIEDSKKDKPQVGKVWIALVSAITIGNERIWFWDIFDVKTRFFLSSHVSSILDQNDARITLSQAVERAGQFPRVVFIDGPITWIKGLKLEYKGESQNVVQKILINAAGVQLLDQFRSSLNARSLIIKRFKYLGSMRRVNYGWQVHYNYLRPYEILNNCTPAFLANIHHSRLSMEVTTYYVNDFWFLWSAMMKCRKGISR